MPQMYKKTTVTSYIFVSKPLYLKQNRAYSRLFDTQTYDMETLFRTERTLSYCPDDLSNLKSSDEQFRLHNEKNIQNMDKKNGSRLSQGMNPKLTLTNTKYNTV